MGCPFRSCSLRTYRGGASEAVGRREWCNVVRYRWRGRRRVRGNIGQGGQWHVVSPHTCILCHSSVYIYVLFLVSVCRGGTPSHMGHLCFSGCCHRQDVQWNSSRDCTLGIQDGDNFSGFFLKACTLRLVLGWCPSSFSFTGHSLPVPKGGGSSV